MLSGCCFCFTNVDFAEPQCPTPIHTTPRNTHLIHVGLCSTGLAPLMCAHKSMIWNVCGDLSSCLNSPPFSWPFPLCYLVLICKGATNLGEKEAKSIPNVWAYKWLETSLPLRCAQPAEPKRK